MWIAFPLYGSHAETARLLSDYVDGELRGYRRWRVARHLARCEMCRRAYRTLLTALEGLHAAADDLPPRPDVADSVVERIRDDDG